MNGQQPANSVIVLDFETTGLSPTQGDRAIEIGAVKIVNGEIVDQFQQLMNPGFRVSHFIEGYTGISNAMLRHASPCEEIMADFAAFIGDANLVAHNAAFDQRFLDAEFHNIHHHYAGAFACSMLIARRLYQDAPNHRLSTLVDYKRIQHDGVFHRALADAEMTAKLWLSMLDDIAQHYGITYIPFEMMQKLAKTPKGSIHTLFKRYA